jgi:hypothetical protein
MSEEKWTPGFGQKYFEEPVFYKSPKVKDFVHDRERTDMPNAAMTKKMKFYTDEEIHSIWAKPVENFEPTEEEIELLQTAPENFFKLLHKTVEAPCYAHMLNSEIDRCKTKGKTHFSTKLSKVLAQQTQPCFKKVLVADTC